MIPTALAVDRCASVRSRRLRSPLWNKGGPEGEKPDRSRSEAVGMRPSRTWGVLRLGLVVVDRGCNEVADHAGTGWARRYAADARGRRRRAPGGRAYRGDAGPQLGGEQSDPGRG